MELPMGEKSDRNRAVIILRDALFVLMGSTLIAGVFNHFRQNGIPWFAEKPYEILVPCPEPMGEAKPLETGDPLIFHEKTVLIDMREIEAYDEWHAPFSLHVWYDYLFEPVPPEVLKKIASSGAENVVVYGNGENPDSGWITGKYLSGNGIKNVYYIKGGAPALKAYLDKALPWKLDRLSKTAK